MSDEDLFEFTPLSARETGLPARVLVGKHAAFPRSGVERREGQRYPRI